MYGGLEKQVAAGQAEVCKVFFSRAISSSDNTFLPGDTFSKGTSSLPGHRQAVQLEHWTLTSELFQYCLCLEWDVYL